MTDQRKPGKVQEETIALSELEVKREKEIPEESSPEAASTKKKHVGKVSEPTEPLPPEQTEHNIDISPEDISQKHSTWSVTFWLFVLFVFSWLIYMTTQTVIDLWQETAWVGMILAVISTALLMAMIILFWREYQSIKKVDALMARTGLIEKAIQTNDIALIRLSLQSVLNNIRKQYPGLISEFEQASASRDSVTDYLKQLDNIVIIQLDEKAEKIIQSEAYRSALAVAISPHPALDAVLVLWRGLVLTKTIAQIYGVELTGITSLIMLKRVVASAIIAAGLEEIGSMGVDAVGNSLLSNAFKSLGEGSIIAWRVYRLGKKTKQVCRPPHIQF